MHARWVAERGENVYQSHSSRDSHPTEERGHRVIEPLGNEEAAQKEQRFEIEERAHHARTTRRVVRRSDQSHHVREIRRVHGFERTSIESSRDSSRDSSRVSDTPKDLNGQNASIDRAERVDVDFRYIVTNGT